MYLLCYRILIRTELQTSEHKLRALSVRLLFISFRPSTCTSCFYWYHTATALLTTGEQWMFLLQVGLWQMSKPASSNLRYCCLQVSFLLFCEKCLSGRVSRRECLSLSCSKCSTWYLSSAKFSPNISSASWTTRITFWALQLLTVRRILFPWHRLRKRLEGELPCACKLFFLLLLSCVPLAAVSLPPVPTRFPSVRLYVCPRCTALSPTAYSTLSSLILGSYQGGDTFLQEAELMMLYDQGRQIWVAEPNSSREQQRQGKCPLATSTEGCE